MEKPTDLPVSTDSKHDYDLTERLVRQLQPSELHVFAVHLMMSLPDAVKTGDPAHDDHVMTSTSLTMVTDGRRGFLILVDEVPEWDAISETVELVSLAARGSVLGETFVVRTATIYEPDESARSRTLRLSDPERVRAEVEREYARAFVDRGSIDHAAFLAAFRPYAPVRDERALREELRSYGDE